MLPKVLYHGSPFLADTALMPGFYHTHELVQWDGTESNRFLYASGSKEVAIEQAVASLIEKRWPVTRFKTDGENKIDIWFDSAKIPKDLDLKDEKVWLYVIEPSNHQNWVQVKNKQNGLQDEWKTTIGIPFTSREEVSVAEHKNNHYTQCVKHK